MKSFLNGDNNRIVVCQETEKEVFYLMVFTSISVIFFLYKACSFINTTQNNFYVSQLMKVTLQL